MTDSDPNTRDISFRLLQKRAMVADMISDEAAPDSLPGVVGELRYELK